MDIDNLTPQQIQSKLKSNYFELVKNEKGNNEIWINDVSLIGQKNENRLTDILEGWAACNYSYMAYRTHSKKDSDGKRKNHGLNGIHDHLKHYKCKLKSKISLTNNKQQNVQITTPSTHPKFAFNKKALPEKYKLKLKDAELKFVVAGSHSFNSLENGGILTLIQTSIEIGANFGLVDVQDIFYGRKTIREEVLLKFTQYTNQIRSLLDEPIQQHCVAGTADVWTDDLMKRSYLDFTVFFVNDAYELKHTMLRCKHFDAPKSGINIWHEIEEIFQSFNLSFGNTPITTDQGSNMIKALSLTDEVRYSCLAHRTNTVLETVWENVKIVNTEFKMFCTSVSNLRTYCQQSGGIQFKLPKTLKSSSGTSPWSSYFLIHNSLHQSYESLLIILRERGEQHRILQIDPQLLHEISTFMENFSLIFDNSEFSNQLTLQNVIPSYYRMTEYCIIDNKRKNSIINLLKVQIAKELDEKYLTSTTQLHWIATYLDPTFKDLLFVIDESYLLEQKKSIKDGIYILADDCKEAFLSNNQSSPKTNLPLTIKRKEDPFAIMRAVRGTASSTTVSASSFTDEIERQLQMYERTLYELPADSNPLIFWRDQQNVSPILSKIAKSVFVIQASSAESERHFSMAGQVVTEKRSQLDPECLESLVVLKEAYLKKTWPK
ncbi:unnamed protein product [Rotaria magnacalcarata]|uniref:HAT C-terminal dimerisation domain-containing protein n=4 Tax=Rotaria magnacalcarata TaxID=392030 RepID=A0A815RTR2_9BILA|nr:unnamed protein product [Rotaria magnacalcarata]CAF1904839.1 unnamed protein product [Rotaria magnacalcarata]CAF3860778.1 unnamed protein product [Rotaria magnacalcarata]CAF3989166.1 unnamed protein product [Rotaria magnacalcarata]